MDAALPITIKPIPQADVILYYVLISHSFTKSLKQSVPRGYNLLETAATMVKTPLTVGHRTLPDIKRSVTGTSVLSSKYWTIMSDTPSARESDFSMWIDDSADEGEAPDSVRGVGPDKPTIADPLQATCNFSSCFVFGFIWYREYFVCNLLVCIWRAALLTKQ